MPNLTFRCGGGFSGERATFDLGSSLLSFATTGNETNTAFGYREGDPKETNQNA